MKNNEFISELKKLMYAEDLNLNHRFTINDIIFKYDKFRAKSEVELRNAGKEWHYRLKKLCNHLGALSDN